MKMILPKTSTPRWVIIIVDLLIALFSLFISYLIRFDIVGNFDELKLELDIILISLPIFLFVKFISFYTLKIHKGLVRFTSTEDLKRIVYATILSTVLIVALSFVRYLFLDQFFLFPVSIIILEFLVSLVLAVGSRFTVKLIYLESLKTNEKKKRVLIWGAGVSGLMTKRTIERDAKIGYEIVGFLDNDKRLKNTRLEGRVIYPTAKLKKILKEEGVDELIIAIQNPSKSNKKEIIDICLEQDVSVVSVPSSTSWVNGEFTTKQIKKINIEDLLGRKEIVLDELKIETELKGKTVLITGAAGSIGSGMVKLLSKYKAKRLILLDQAESPLYDLQNELIQKYNFTNFEVVVGDIRSAHRMHRLFDEFKPEIVFHAAAYKHVPLMEDNPSEAILTNVKGTKNLVDCSDVFGVKKFVMVSTDKAVNPTNVMGASKRIAEIYAQVKNGKSKTQYITTRFGNVLGSNGSVIPLFRKQLEQGGPLTVTHQEVTRFFMTIPEACQLVLEAGTMGEGGEIFVFDMGESVKIIDLAKKMIRLSGMEVGKDIDIKITGLRPGEKLYEELLSNEENTLNTHHPQILKAKIRIEDPIQVERVNNLINMFDDQNNVEIVKQMKEIVPEFKSNNSVYEKLDR